MASNITYFTGISILNPGPIDADTKLDLLDKNGILLASREMVVKARGRSSGLITEYFPALEGQDIHSGYIRILSDQGLHACALFGTNALSALSAIPALGN